MSNALALHAPTDTRFIPVGVHDIKPKKSENLFAKLLPEKSHILAATTISCGLVVDFFLPSPLAVCARKCAWLALAYLSYKNRKHLWYELSLAFIYSLEKIKRISGHRWYNEITPQIILGAIPLKNLSHEEDMNGVGVRAVLSLLEDHEAHTVSMVGDPVLKSDWENRAVTYLQIPIQDLAAPSIDKIEAAVAFIKTQSENNKKTYIHCKAGRGRSATIVISYLMKHHAEEIGNFKLDKDFVEKAIKFVKTKRPQISLTRWQKQALKDYHSHLKKHQLLSS